uniref:Uncharacterized protein n=1 Tax=Scylla olivacea TaxID=85551 RepID=A0A0P4WHS8_SCYOL
MFRSKAAELPPCPHRPSWEDMEEDLKNSKKSDVVFNIAKTTLASKGSKEERRPSTSDSEATEVASKDASEEEMFQLAVEFVERNDSLMASTEQLAEESERLREVSESLRETVEEVKKQALVAIDGC